MTGGKYSLLMTAKERKRLDVGKSILLGWSRPYRTWSQIKMAFLTKNKGKETSAPFPL